MMRLIWASRWSAKQHRPWVWWRGRTWRSLSSWDQPQGSRRQPACDKWNLSSSRTISNPWGRSSCKYQLTTSMGKYQLSVFDTNTSTNILVLDTKYLILQVTMGEYHTLRQACCAACVKHHRSILNLFFLTTLTFSIFIWSQPHLSCDLHWLESCLCPWLSNLLHLNSKSLYLEVWLLVQEKNRCRTLCLEQAVLSTTSAPESSRQCFRLAGGWVEHRGTK